MPQQAARTTTPSRRTKKTALQADIQPDPTDASRQQIRTAATRKALLDAAFRIFVRDGFEASRIEDIAAAAGRSRGAFYANFTSKAEVFLALRAERFTAWEERFRKQLQNQPTRERQLKIVEEEVAVIVLDKSYALLELEFKLFAIRHPEMLADIVQKHLDEDCRIEELREFYPKGKRGTIVMQQEMLAIESLLEGFALNVAFSPEVMTPKYIAKYLPRMARLILERIS